MKKPIFIITLVLFCACSTAIVEEPQEERRESPPEVDLTALLEKAERDKAIADMVLFAHLNRTILSRGTDFALRTFKQVSGEYAQDNLFLSPFSLACALGMLYNGAENETKEEIAAVMGMQDNTPEEINKYYQTLSRGLMSIDDSPIITTKGPPKAELGIANAIWSDVLYPVRKSFADLTKLYYDAEAQSMDFSQPSALKAINDWCNEKTKGTIPKILDALYPPMVIANAVYYKSSWSVPFEKSKTEEKPFYNQDGTTSIVQMMHQKELLLNYAHTTGYEFVRVPYGNGHFAMILVLPKEGTDIEEVIEEIDNATWNTLTRDMTGNTVLVTLSMPRFNLRGEIPLNNVLKAMGMPRAFSSEEAQFLAMLEVHSWVGRVLQKSYIDVNEEGTEASAVTVIQMVMSTGLPLPPPQKATVVVDRPFLFAITEQSTGVILFMGKVLGL